MQKIIVTDSNIIIKLAIMFMEGDLDLNNLSTICLYVPEWIIQETKNLLRYSGNQERLGDIIKWIEENITPLNNLPDVSDDELDDEYEYYSAIYDDLLDSEYRTELSDSPSKIDVKLLVLAEKNKVYLATHEGSLFFFCRHYYNEKRAMRLSDILIALYEAGDITKEQIYEGRDRLDSKKDYFRKEDNIKLRDYFKNRK